MNSNRNVTVMNRFSWVVKPNICVVPTTSSQNIKPDNDNKLSTIDAIPVNK